MSTATIGGILIASWGLSLLVLLMIAQAKYSDFLEYVRKRKPEYREDLGGLWVAKDGGGWIGEEFWLRTPVPIEFETKDKKLNDLIDNHNGTIKLYWRIVAIGVVVLVAFGTYNLYQK